MQVIFPEIKNINTSYVLIFFWGECSRGSYDNVVSYHISLDHIDFITSPDSSYYYFLHLLATSKIQKYNGFLSEDEYVLIHEGTLDFFPRATLLVVHNIFSTSEDDFLRYSADYQGALGLKICQELQEKILKSKFVRKFEKDIIQRSLGNGS